MHSMTALERDFRRDVITPLSSSSSSSDDDEDYDDDDFTTYLPKKTK